jgi:branched-chain amino acid transport system ATP-binding protein
MTNALLEASSLIGGYGRVQLLTDVSMTVREGETTALLGPNGCGKTTLMRTIIGLNKPWSGRIMFRKRDVTYMECHERVAGGLGMVPPGRRLFLGLSVEDNLKMGAYLYRERRAVAAGLQLAYQYFPVLREYRRQIAGRLSGGEQQMCAIARGLMSRPKLLMIDELSLGLAPKIVATLVATLREIRAEQDIALVLVEQDVSVAMATADYAYILSQGTVALEGHPRNLMSEGEVTQEVRDIFLGLSRSEDRRGWGSSEVNGGRATTAF